MELRTDRAFDSIFSGIGIGSVACATAGSKPYLKRRRRGDARSCPDGDADAVAAADPEFRASVRGMMELAPSSSPRSMLSARQRSARVAES